MLVLGNVLLPLDKDIAQHKQVQESQFKPRLEAKLSLVLPISPQQTILFVSITDNRALAQHQQ